LHPIHVVNAIQSHKVRVVQEIVIHSVRIILNDDKNVAIVTKDVRVTLETFALSDIIEELGVRGRKRLQIGNIILKTTQIKIVIPISRRKLNGTWMAVKGVHVIVPRCSLKKAFSDYGRSISILRNRGRNH
jgi:hypothetical protein